MWQCHAIGRSVLAWAWAGLGWAGLGWAGLGWAGLGWAGLGWAGLGWAGLVSQLACVVRPCVGCWWLPPQG
jgi:hypothetical protein